jgi:hypothetical protein
VVGSAAKRYRGTNHLTRSIRKDRLLAASFVPAASVGGIKRHKECLWNSF